MNATCLGCTGIGSWKNKFYSLYIPTYCGVCGDGQFGSGSMLDTRLGHGVNRKIASYVYRAQKNLRTGGQSKTVPDSVKADLASFIHLNTGMTYNNSMSIACRRIADIRHVEQVIHGAFDALLLAYQDDFKLQKPSRFLRKLWTGIVRSCLIRFANGASYEDLIADWKEITTYLWVNVTKAEVIEVPTLKVTNVFYRLIYERRVKRMLSKGLKDKRDCELMAHLTSTRQMPCGGRQSKRKALTKFVETISNEFQMNLNDLLELELSARAVGEKTRHLMKDAGKELSSSTHISLSTAGDYEVPSAAGGRGKAIRSSAHRILTVVPKETRTVLLPCGVLVKEEEGVERYRTWFRPKKLKVDLESTLGDEKPRNLEGNYKVSYWGYDEALGSQLLAAALIEAREHGVFSREAPYDLNVVIPPIPSRVATVHEPGGKTRIVTTTLWWNIILQQSLGHMLREILSHHVSATDGLKRADQAWLLLHGLSNVRDLPPDWCVLSSDLAEATDAIPSGAPISATLRGFMKGVGVLVSPLMDTAIQLALSPRDVEIAWGRGKVTHHTKVRGIFMGEPLAKAMLTILNLCTEEDAMRKYLNIPYFAHDSSGEQCLTVVPYISWRCFRVGGDDHFGIGPLAYLNRITANHVRWGSKISSNKHGVVKKNSAVKYCEKGLFFKDKDLSMKPADVNRSPESYDSSVFVDSVKVRLITPHSTSSRDSENDRNTAIGKGLSLGRTLRWLNPKYFPLVWVKAVRNRFIARAGPLFPKGKGLRAHLLMPQVVGGLDLYLGEELTSLWDDLPLPTQRAVWGVIDDDLTHKERRLLTSFLTNDIRRGIRTSLSLKERAEEEGLRSYFHSIGFPVPREQTVLDCKKEFQVPYGITPGEVMRFLNNLGWYTFDEVMEEVLRSETFTKILLGSPTEKYNTTPWKIRYSALWDQILLRGPHPEHYKCPGPESFKRLAWASNFNSLKLYYLNNSTSYAIKSVRAESFLTGKIPSCPLVMKATARDLLNQDAPSLRISCLDTIEVVSILPQLFVGCRVGDPPLAEVPEDDAEVVRREEEYLLDKLAEKAVVLRDCVVGRKLPPFLRLAATKLFGSSGR